MSSLQRMSVVVKNLKTKELIAFCKGSPEAIFKLSKKNTIPENYHKELHKYAHQGYRVLACGYKRLEDISWRQIQKLSRNETESNLNFLGFIIMQNKLKKETTKTIRILNKANIRNVMVTGILIIVMI